MDDKGTHFYPAFSYQRKGNPLLFYVLLKLHNDTEFFEWIEQERTNEEALRKIQKKARHFQACFQFEKAKKVRDLLEIFDIPEREIVLEIVLEILWFLNSAVS
jgi:hypothetical protein